MRPLVTLFLLPVVGRCALALGTGPVSQPTTAPASGEISSLIAKLGDTDFHVRRDASNRLRQIGAPALPALRQAADSSDPEVQARARQLIHALEYRHVPGRPLRHGGASTVSITIANGHRSIDVDDQGRRINISQDGSGIVMTVEGEIDGQPARETYKAKNAEQLRSSNEEAYALYERYADLATPGDFIALQPFGGGAILQPAIVPMRRGDDLAALQDRLDQQMQEKNLTQFQRKQVKDALEKVREDQLNIDANPGQPADKDVQQYEDSCDALRKVLKDLKLPDPGEVLPPPRQARLGITTRPPLPGDSGCFVSHVAPGSRGQAIGLKDNDEIRKVNGEQVHDYKDLRRLVTENPKHLVVDITRDGQDLKLEEK